MYNLMSGSMSGFLNELMTVLMKLIVSESMDELMSWSGLGIIS